ncbi:MAG TPA: type II toxin-antitoxin system VapC family toxin [Acidobacteriota bacterium]|nr:type II toxin-antitoxin system VapC family toxin [Acidobacteriota bacterium]
MYLLDTDILIYSLKGDPRVRARLERHRSDPQAVSVISVMELYYGAYKSERTLSNLAKVRQIEKTFPVLPLASESAETFGSLKNSLESDGTRLEDFDLAIAATALAHNLTLVSNNIRHFDRIDGLRLESWAD